MTKDLISYHVWPTGITWSELNDEKNQELVGTEMVN